jgi:hypothetical protein
MPSLPNGIGFLPQRTRLLVRRARRRPEFPWTMRTNGKGRRVRRGGDDEGAPLSDRRHDERGHSDWRPRQVTGIACYASAKRGCLRRERVLRTW